MIPKKQRFKYRLIIDYRKVNDFCCKLPVHYDSLDDVRMLFGSTRPVRSLASIDVSDGYHHFLINSDFARYFAFHIEGEYFQANTLPFGWN